MSKQNNWFFRVSGAHKENLIRRRSEFMGLFLRCLVESDVDKEILDELDKKFGVRLLTSTNSSNSLTVLQDGEVVHKQ